MSGLEDAPEARVRLEKLPLEVGRRLHAWRPTTPRKAAITRALRTTRLGDRGGDPVRAGAAPERAAEVTYEVKPGRRLRFGPIFIAGTSAVSRDLVREQASRRGEERRLVRRVEAGEGSERGCSILGVFAGVRVTRGTPSAERGIVPVGGRRARGAVPHRARRPRLGFEATRWEARANGGLAAPQPARATLRSVGADLRVGYAWLPTPFGPQQRGVVGLARARVLAAGRDRQPHRRRRPAGDRARASSRLRLLVGAACSSACRSGIAHALDVRPLLQPRGVPALQRDRDHDAAGESRGPEPAAAPRGLHRAASACSPTWSSGSPGTAGTIR